MVIELCNCDWGLGAKLPWHDHAVLVHVRRLDDGFEMWTRNFIPQKGWLVLAEVEELLFNVPWKDLWRELYAITTETPAHV